MAIFDTYHDAPLGGRPDIEGDSAKAHDIATEGTRGLVDHRDRVLKATDDGLNADGKARLIAKDRLARQSKFDAAKALVAREGSAIDVLDAELRRDAGLDAPSPDSAAAIRASEIRGHFKALGPSEKLAALHSGEKETLLALFHAPAIAGLLDDKSRGVIEDRLLGSTDPKRHAALKSRRAAHGQAAYAVETAERWADAKSGVPAQALRERIAELGRK